MEIKLYKWNKDNIVVNKDLDSVTSTSITGDFRNEIDLINPVIQIQGASANITLLNYASFSLGTITRYYFIQKWVINRKDLFTMYLMEDVLMTFKTPILNLKPLVLRNENTFDLTIKDDLVSYTYDKVLSKIDIDTTNATITFNPNPTLIDNSFIINVVNNTSSLNTDTITPPDYSTDTTLSKVSGWITGVSSFVKSYSTYQAQVLQMCEYLQESSASNLGDSIVSIMVYPFTIPHNTTSHHLKVKSSEMNVDVYDLTKSASEYFVLGEFTLEDSYLKWFDYQPYTQYQLYLPYYGMVDIDKSVVLNHKIKIMYQVNYTTGNAQVMLYDTISKMVVFSSSCQLGVEISKSSTNKYEVEANKQANNISTGLGVLASSVGIIGGVATSNPIAVTGGAISLASNVASYVKNNNMNYVKSSGVVTSGFSGLYQPQQAYIRVIKYIYTNVDDNYKKLYGFPLNQFKKLSTLTGFTLVGDFHLEGFNNSNDDEKALIENALKSGIIL